MVINHGDEFIAKKNVSEFLEASDIVKVICVEDGFVSFEFGKHFPFVGLMTISEFEEYFEKVVHEKESPIITNELVSEIIANSEIEIATAFDKCTVVACKLPNGFVIVESSACVSPENYDEDIGVEICMGKIENKIWELEGYNLQQKLYYNSYDEYDKPEDYDCCDECCYQDCKYDNHKN